MENNKSIRPYAQGLADEFCMKLVSCNSTGTYSNNNDRAIAMHIDTPQLNNAMLHQGISTMSPYTGTLDNPYLLQTNTNKQWRDSEFIPIKIWKNIEDSTELDKYSSIILYGRKVGENFVIAINHKNTQYSTGLTYGKLAIKFFRAYTENKATREYKNGKLIFLNNITRSYNKDGRSITYNYEIKVDENDHLLMRENFGEWKQITWVKFIQIILNQSHYDALATLSSLVGLNFENFIKLTSHKYTADTMGKKGARNEILEIIKTIENSKIISPYWLKYSVPILGYAGQTISALAIYSDGNDEFCVPATVSDGSLAIGECKPTAYFYNRHLIDEYPDAIIILCQDARMAHKLQERLESIKTYNPSEYIIISHLGTDLSVLDWNDLRYRTVIFLPAPTLESIARAKSYATYLKDIGAEFRVATKFLLPFHKNLISTDEYATLGDAEKQFLENSLCVDDLEQPLRDMQSIINDAIPIKKHEELWVNLGIFKDTTPDCRDGDSHKLSVSRSIKIDPALLPPRAMSMKDVTINHILRPHSLVTLIGVKGAGKTQFSYLLVKGGLNHKSTVPIFNNPANIAIGNICMVDKETPLDELKENLIQHGLDCEVGKRLFVLHPEWDSLPDFAKNFTLNDPAFLEGLAIYARQKGCSVICLDNLASLMGDKVNYASKAQELLDWCEQLLAEGICIVLLIHKSDEVSDKNKDKTCGSQNFKKSARTIINLFGKDEIIFGKLGTQLVQEFAEKDGLTVGMNFADSKPAPILDNKTIWLNLPLGADEWKALCLTGFNGEEIQPERISENDAAGCSMPDVPQVPASQVIDVHAVPNNLAFGQMGLSPNAQKVLDALQELGGKAAIGELTDNLAGQPGLKEDSIRDRLKDLIRLGLVETHGTGKGTYYQIVEPTIH